MTRIMLADDYEVVRQGLRRILESREDWEICGEVSDGRAAVELAIKLKPDVVVIDLSMRELNGLETTRRIRQALPNTEALIFTARESMELIREALAAGARGYILKSESGPRIIEAIEALATHQPYFTPRVSETLLNAKPYASAEHDYLGEAMFSGNRSLRAFISGAFVALSLVSIAAAQDKIIDFTQPRPMKPLGLIPLPDRGAGMIAPDDNRTASGALRITLEEAQTQAVSSQALILARRGVDAARYRRQAVQADYFPKVNAFFSNLHFNKFMGDTIQLARFRRTFAVPLFDKDQTYVGATVTQPLTPLFKVHEAVRIARADERIAEAKANAVLAHLTADVERAYFELLIAQRRRTEAEANVETAERKLQIASAATTAPDGMTERETALFEAKKSLLAANDKVTELTNSFTYLTGFPDDARLELAAPPPLVETDSSTQKPRPVIAYSPQIVEAEEAVVKARAAHRLARLEYVPDVAITGGYMYQTGIPVLPGDFSWIGVIATFTLFDFFKRERTIKERGAQVDMAKANLQLVRAKVASGAQKTVMDLDRTRRILELTRQVASMQRAVTPRDQDPGPETRAALAKAEAEMFQADLDYRTAYAELKRAAGEQ